MLRRPNLGLMLKLCGVALILLCLSNGAFSFSSTMLRPGTCHLETGNLNPTSCCFGGRLSAHGVTVLRKEGTRSCLFGLRSNSAKKRLQSVALQSMEAGQGGQDQTNATEIDDEVDNRGLWGEWTDIEVQAATVMWINSLVIGLDLCPFALESMPGLRVVVSNAIEKEDALDVLAEEMGYLVDTPTTKPATTLVVFPLELFDRESFDIDYAPEESLEGSEADEEAQAQAQEEEEEEEEGLSNMVPQDPNFVSFMQLAREGSEISQDLYGDDPQTEILLLTFHPNSTFSDRPFDPAEYALRSPFPTIHLLRGSDVRSAERRCDSQNKTTEDIAIANEARLRGVGYTELSTALEECYSKARGLES